ncbi:MAG: EamA family transporter, partial [Rhodobacteraceae bacterium]|nr:EamA family transporter [Paracoccaceae bacterium]
VWAFTKAPIAVVASLRETSILFAVLIGTIFLKEPMTNLRWASIGLIAIGAIAIKI